MQHNEEENIKTCKNGHTMTGIGFDECPECEERWIESDITTTENKWLSKCCFKDVTVVGSIEGTNHWECTECKKSCDAYIAQPIPHTTEDFEKRFENMINNINFDAPLSDRDYDKCIAFIRKERELAESSAYTRGQEDKNNEILGWLGMWRDHMKIHAVHALQDILTNTNHE